MKFDVIIIGSGLGGLLCGNILSREGYSVCILEKNHKPGGSLQTFGRKARIFNTGLNYTESLDDGQILNQYFRYFGIEKVKFKRLDEDGFEMISFPDGKYPMAIGHDNFRKRLTEYFPGEKDNLKAYLNKIKSICDSIPLYNLSESHFNIFECESFGVGAADYIRSVISDPRLQNILAGNNLMYAGNENRTPLLIHSLIGNSFIESAWRVVDGSHHLINALVDSVKSKGGCLMTNANAVRFISENNRISAVQLSSGEQIEGKYFISNTHPCHVLSMARDFRITRTFSYRINSLQDTPGIFTLYLVFKKDSFPYFNYNFHHFNQDNVWIAGSYDPSKWPQTYVMMPNASSASADYAESASVLTYMSMDELAGWKNTSTGKRGEAYEEFKRMKSRTLLESVERQFPGIGSCVETFYSSTPLTWRDYTGTREGSAYGLVKDYHKPMQSVVLPMTKIPNLFLTGQNTNLHGILGVTISSVNACGQIIGTSYLINKIRNA